jgi:hypothetical protein
MTDTEVLAALAAPFSSDCIEWKPAGKAAPDGKTRVLPYLTGAAVETRLDAVCGLGWSFDFEKLTQDAAGVILSGIGRLTINGTTRAGLGTASEWEPSKGCATDSLKRAAALFGVGRYLAELPEVYCQLDAHKRIPAAFLATLAQCLDKRAQAATQAA